MKKFLLLFMALFALVLPARAFYSEHFIVDDLHYVNTWDDEWEYSYEVSVVGYSGLDTDVVIPQFVTYNNNRYIVTEVQGDYMEYEGAVTFADNTLIESITLPNSITSIQGCSFRGCSNLKTVTISPSISYIGSEAFAGCSSLLSFELPENLTQISNGLFTNCAVLQSVSIPDNIKEIGAYAFAGCASLKNIDIPESVQSIGDAAFSGCVSLQTISLPSALKIIESGTFAGCGSLRNIEIPKNVEAIEDHAFESCQSILTIEIPNTVSSIGYGAFSNCSNLQFVELSMSLLAIESYTFSSCGALKSITIPNTVKRIEEWAFSYCYSLTKLIIPDSVISIGEYAFAYSSISKIYALSPEAPQCAYNAFDGEYPEVIVPLGSLQSYLQAPGWSRLSNYRERGVRFDKESLGMQLDETYQLTPLFIGADNGETFSYEWATDNGDVITVDQDGMIKAVGLGSATVTATTTDSNDITYTATCRIEVKTDFDLSHSAITINSDESFQLGIISDDNEAVYTWTSSDPSIAYVNECGLVNAMGVEGECVISAVKDGIAVNCTVSVTDFNVGTFPEGVNYTIGKKNTITITESPEAEGDVYIPDYVRLDGEMYCVNKIGDNAFANAGDRITSIYIPNSVEEIGKEAFRDCTALTYVHLGSELVSIGERAFSYAKIDVLECEAVIPPYLFKDCFLGVEVKLLRVPTSALVAYLTTNYEGAYGWKGLGNDIEGANFENSRIATRAEGESSKLDPTAIIFESVSKDPYMMNVRLEPVGACTVIEWASSNQEVATIDRGLITFLDEEGTSVFMAVTSNGLIAESPEVSGIEEIFSDNGREVKIYNMQGVCLKHNATKADVDSLAPGLYIINGRKVLVK